MFEEWLSEIPCLVSSDAFE